MVIFNIVILSGSCYPFNMVIFLSFLHVYQRVNHMSPYYTISIHFHYFPKSKMYISIYTPYILLTSKYQRYPQHVTSHLPAISPYYTIYYTIWGWVKTLVPCREPQVIAGLKWMFIPLKYGIYRYWPIPILRIETKNVYIYIYTHTIYYTLLHHIWPYIHQRVTPHEIPMAVVAPSLRRSTLGISTGEVLWVGRARKDTWRWVGWAEEWLGEMYIYCIYIY